jgi:hypothetical protein
MGCPVSRTSRRNADVLHRSPEVLALGALVQRQQSLVDPGVAEVGVEEGEAHGRVGQDAVHQRERAVPVGDGLDRRLARGLQVVEHQADQEAGDHEGQDTAELLRVVGAQAPPRVEEEQGQEDRRAGDGQQSRGQPARQGGEDHGHEEPHGGDEEPLAVPRGAGEGGGHHRAEHHDGDDDAARGATESQGAPRHHVHRLTSPHRGAA